MQKTIIKNINLTDLCKLVAHADFQFFFIDLNIIQYF